MEFHGLRRVCVKERYRARRAPVVRMAFMKDRFPLSTLLSYALVAFTIEFDNEAERRLPHATRLQGRTPGALYAPWLVSMVMWFNCMRYVDDRGVTPRELKRLARTGTNLRGMERWRYVTVGPDPAGGRSRPPRSAWLIRARPGGRMAREIWGPLFQVIERRWEERFGEPEFRELRELLRAIVDQLEPGLPDCLPILGYGLFSSAPDAEAGALPARSAKDHGTEAGVEAGPQGSISDLPLPALLSRVLLAFAIEFERESEVSLAIGADVLRLFGEAGTAERQAVRIRDLPHLSGVSKEAIAMAVSYLWKRGYASLGLGSSGSTEKTLALTLKGRRARDSYFQLLSTIEARWRKQFGAQKVRRLRKSLEPLAGDGTAKGSPLFSGLEPYPEGWRALVRQSECLPHYPMVLHRGGFLDGG
jgi:DNA-binding MarR family transcriptional regulator